jgi:uncharacterized lipoprotein YmbA
MSKNIKHLVALAFIATVVAGCASAPARFYTLSSTAKAEGTPAANYAVLIEPISVPAEVDRPQFTVQTGPNRVQIAEFDRWAAPLNENIARTIAGDLVTLLGTPRVATGALSNFDPAYRVALDIQRFDSVPNKSVLIEAVWVARRTAGGAARSGRTVASEPVQGDNFDALAAAHSRALAKVSGGIAAAIRELADAKP